MTDTKRHQCPRCERYFAVRHDGTLRSHRIGTKQCPGTGHLPLPKL